MLSEEQIDFLMAMKYIGDKPRFYVPAHVAFALRERPVSLFLLLWWDFLPAGFTQFMFADNNRAGQSELHILKMRPDDSHMDVPDILHSEEMVNIVGIECPPEYLSEALIPLPFEGE